MMPGSVVGGTQSFIGAVFGITGAADETIGEKLRNMPESAAQRILQQNGIPYKKNMTKEELVQFIDDMIEKAEAVRDDLEVWEGEDGEDEGDVSGSHSESKSDSTLNSTEKETTEAKGERLRRNGVSRMKRTSLQPRKMTLDGLCEKMVPRVKTFREAQKNVLKFKGVRGALTSRIKILATTCPIGWIVGVSTALLSAKHILIITMGRPLLKVLENSSVVVRLGIWPHKRKRNRRRQPQKQKPKP